ncbi:MAG: ABC transporter permease subunit [Streptosporangiales bacterium]|nr:ABC transporter permease subunit [Streptosporangiales bacterium]
MTFTGILQFFENNPGFLAGHAAGQLLLALVAVAIAMVISLPIGLVTGHMRRWSFIAINGGSLARALPTLAIIAIGIPLWGIGFLNITVGLVVLGIPPILTNTYVAVATTDERAVEAARGMGMRPTQILTRVELPAALPLIVAGIRTSSVFVIATAYMASFAGSNSTLGIIITNDGNYGMSGVMAATVVVVVMAFIVEGLLLACQRMLTPRGIRLLRETS